MKLLRRSALVAGALTCLAVPAVAQDLDFVLINQSGYDVVAFYAAPTDVDSWEEDILGNDILESGYRVTVTIADGRSQCDYDLRFEFDDGDVMEDTADLCELGSYTIE